MSPVLSVSILARALGIVVLVFSLGGGAWAQSPVHAKIKADTSVTVGSNTIPLAAGAEVKVFSVHGDKAVIQFNAADGSPVITEVAVTILEPDAPPAPTTTPTPTSATPTNTVSLPATNAPSVSVPPLAVPAPVRVTTATTSAGAAPVASSLPLTPGWHTLKFPELPLPETLPAWPTYVPKAEDETFHLYVPKGYDPAKTYGFLGWTDFADGRAPGKFNKVFDDYGLIAVCNDKAGNQASLDRRIVLMVSALLEISKWARIDPARHFLSGFSGGARASCIAAFCYPDLFTGVVPWCGADFYRDAPAIGRNNISYYCFAREFKVDPPTTEMVLKTRDQVRFALLTGMKDSNLPLVQSDAAAMKDEKFHVKVIVEPDLGHSVGSEATMRQGLDYLLKTGDDSDANESPSP